MVVFTREMLNDLIKVKEEFEAIIESMELMNDKKFMASHKKAKNQIAKRDFDKCIWDFSKN